MKPSASALASLIEANFRERRWDRAREHFIELIGSGLEPSAICLLQAYTIEEVAGRTERAAELLSVLKTNPGWDLLLEAHARAQELLSRPAPAKEKQTPVQKKGDTKATPKAKAKATTKKQK